MRLLLVTDDEPTAALPALAALDHDVVTVGPRRPRGGPEPHTVDVAVVDATGALGPAVSACRTLSSGHPRLPVVLSVSQAVMATVKAAWGFTGWVHRDAAPAELGARLRLARLRGGAGDDGSTVRAGPLVIDRGAYVARAGDTPLDLTPTEFEVLLALASQAGRVLSREALLRRAWDESDHYGGIRRVDVYIRRLRAKLGPEREQLIQTVRGVGYRLDPDR